MKAKHLRLLLGALFVLAIAWTIESCSKKHETPAVVKTDLKAAIVADSTAAASSHEGVGTGDYLKGSQAPFLAAIAAAEVVYNNPSATQADVNAAIANLAAASATFASNLVTPIDPDNLVGQWTFDEIATATAGATVTDNSGHSHNGTLKAGDAHWGGSGVPTLVADRYGNANKALHFDMGQNVEIPYSTSLNPQIMSISLWEKQDVEGSVYADQYMVSMNRWNTYKFQMQGTLKPFFTAHVAISPGDSTYYDRDYHADNGLPQGTWYHIVVTFGNGHEIYYVNGALVYDWGAVGGEEVPGTIVNISADPVNLVFGQDLPTGGYDSNFGGYFHGALDEIRIYNSILTQAQVTQIYNLEKP